MDILLTSRPDLSGYNLQDLCLPVPLAEDEDCPDGGNPSESSAIVSSGREPSGVLGRILVGNGLPEYYTSQEGMRFHRLVTVELPEALFNKTFLSEAFHTILNRIAGGESNPAAGDLLWFELGRQEYGVILRKEYDESGNRFVKESRLIAEAIVNNYKQQ